METTKPSNLWADVKRSGGSYWKCKEIGDRVYGVVIELSVGHSIDGDECPQFEVQPRDGSDPITVTCSQAMLKNLVLDDPPEVGATVDIELVDIDTSRGRTLKKFSYTMVPA
jgi:hypothetical protein